MTTESRVLVVGDSYMSTEVFRTAFDRVAVAADYLTVSKTRPPSWDTGSVREFEGDPAEIHEHLRETHEVLVVHGAPVTGELLAKHPHLRLVACARGGPVNVDLAAARSADVRVTTSPGKNAEAVAELTLGFLIALTRHLTVSADGVVQGARSGTVLATSTFEGAQWFGHELGATTLGLVGLGRVGRLVARKAVGLGVPVVAYDPIYTGLASGDHEGAEMVDSLGELLVRSTVLSLHARATPDNVNLIGAAELAALPTGSFVINTARESLLDEEALLASLRRGHTAGAGLDVCRPDGPWRQLAAMPRVIVAPHIAGATYQTLSRGADMVAMDVSSYLHGRELRWPAG